MAKGFPASPKKIKRPKPSNRRAFIKAGTRAGMGPGGPQGRGKKIC